MIDGFATAAITLVLAGCMSSSTSATRRVGGRCSAPPVGVVWTS